jgi:hypothetical protein
MQFQHSAINRNGRPASSAGRTRPGWYCGRKRQRPPIAAGRRRARAPAIRCRSPSARGQRFPSNEFPPDRSLSHPPQHRRRADPRARRNSHRTMFSPKRHDRVHTKALTYPLPIASAGSYSNTGCGTGTPCAYAIRITRNCTPDGRNGLSGLPGLSWRETRRRRAAPSTRSKISVRLIPPSVGTTTFSIRAAAPNRRPIASRNGSSWSPEFFFRGFTPELFLADSPGIPSLYVPDGRGCKRSFSANEREGQELRVIRLLKLKYISKH